jgi:Leucine-rich repeat (LRR) protein
MNDLPDECYENIFSKFSDTELRLIHPVSKKFYGISKKMLRTFPIEELEKDNNPANFIRDKVYGVSRYFRLRFDKRKYVDLEHNPNNKKRYIKGREITALKLTSIPPELENYDISNLTYVEVNPFVFRHVIVPGFETILTSCKKINKLVIPRLHISTSILAAIENMDSLQDLQISDCRLPRGLKMVTFPKSLRSMDCTFVRFDCDHNISELSNLTSLNMADICADVSEICKLSKLTNLEHLNISWNEPGHIMSSITQLTKLISFKAMMSRIGLFDNIDNMRHLTNLQILNLENCDVTSAQLDWISDKHTLKELYLAYNTIDYHGIKQICKCKCVQVLDISYNSLDDIACEIIGNNDWIRLKSLDVSGNSITDISANMLANLNMLKLDLTRNFLSQDCIDDIYNWSKIKDLKCYPQRSYPENIPPDFWQEM